MEMSWEREGREGGREAIRQPGSTTFRLAEVNRAREHTVAEVENRVLERG